MKKSFGINTVAAGLSALLLAGSLAGCAMQAEETPFSVSETTEAVTVPETTVAATKAAVQSETKSWAGKTDGYDDPGYGETNAEYLLAEEACYDAAMVPSYGGIGGVGGDGGSGGANSRSYGGYYDIDGYGCFACTTGEEYTHVNENGFTSVAESPLSTFSADVDTASYANVRHMLTDYGWIYDTDAIRIEEMINYFDYDYALPKKNEVFGVTTQYTDCPWNPKANLLLVGVRTEDIETEKRPDSNFVFLIDVSGSMADYNKLPLLQRAFGMLAEDLTSSDRVSIVTYSGVESVVLDGERGSNTKRIVDALNSLTADGCTAGEAGIRKAYDIAEKNFIEGGNNRIILATDGDLNVGISSVEELNDLVSEKKESGVFLSVLGVGDGNLKDNKLETLADNGNGNYSYIDNISEAKKVLVEEMNGTLVTVAKDVKFQVEFNPEQVKSYRLVGYENRVLAEEDFADDTVDAGEVGAGHTVTVLYEIIPVGGTSGIELKYQPEKKTARTSEKDSAPYADELLTVSVRYKEPNGEVSKLRSYPVIAADYTENMPAEAAWASAVAEFGMLLKGSSYAGDSCKADVRRLAEDAMTAYSDEYRKEFYSLAGTFLY